MKLTVKNFGPIKSAEVDIKPMTVFIGPSNTGKSYMAILLYTIAKVLKEPFARTIGRTVIRETFESLIGKYDKTPKTIYNKESLIETTEKLRTKFASAIKNSWEGEVLRCFGEEWKNLKNNNTSDKIFITISTDDNKLILNLLEEENDKFPPMDDILKSIKEKMSSQLDSKNNYHHLDNIYDLIDATMHEIYALFSFLPNQSQADNSRLKYMRESITNTHYLPAVRGGIMQSHRILVSSIINKASTIGLTGTEIVPFTGVLADFLNKLLNISNIDSKRHYRQRKNKGILDLSARIEQDIMHGEIKVKKLATGYPDFRYNFANQNEKKQDISLIYASSSVSELAPIVLFIRHYLSADDIFIVEEPEAHLHPTAQRIIAGLLVELVKAKVNVIVTTHSDIILEQISNFIHADKVPETEILKEKSEGRTLSKEEAGIYWFKETKNGEGTNVKKNIFDEDVGVLTEDHLDVSADLYNETVDILEKRDRIKGDNND